MSCFPFNPFPFILESVHLCEIKECRRRKHGTVGHEVLFRVISMHLNLVNSGYSFPVRFCF